MKVKRVYSVVEVELEDNLVISFFKDSDSGMIVPMTTDTPDLNVVDIATEEEIDVAMNIAYEILNK